VMAKGHRPIPAESLEESTAAKGNAGQSTTDRTQSRGSVSMGLARMREAARRDRKMKFTGLLDHLTPELLQYSFTQLRHEASAGVDRVRWVRYAEDLEENLVRLHEAVHLGTYRAKPSRRVYLPKPDGRKRPIGIGALEDKIVQHALAMILNQIYEQDFKGFSYGFRSGRSQHDALDGPYDAACELGA